MGNNLNVCQNPQEVSRRLLSIEYFSQEGESLESTKLFTVVKLSSDGQNYLIGKAHLKSQDLSRFEDAYEQVKKKLLSSINPHILHSEKVTTLDKSLYVLVRQFIDKTLRKKLRTPPFFNMIEKLWLSFQCLKAVEQLHYLNLTHGDIKTENFLVTSWNWVYLADLAYYKPSFLIEGDLTSYKLFFAPGERPACYLAPEKFVVKGRDDKKTQEMDVFSLACVIAEIWLDGQYLFTLPDLLNYKKTGVVARLAQIKHEKVRCMLESMLSLNPESRKMASEYVSFFMAEVISQDLIEIYAFFVRMTVNINNPDAYSRILLIKEKLSTITGESNVILTTCIATNIRNVKTPDHLVDSLQVLTSLSNQCSDYCKLHKILPFVLSILHNKSERAKVKVEGLHSTLSLLKDVKVSNARDSHLFPEYIWPTLASLANEESEFVKCEFSKSLPEIARLGKKFLKAFHDFSEKPGNWESDFEKFTDKFIKVFKFLIVSKPECQVQVELLRNFGEMSVFLDKRSVLNNLVPIILSWLNKGDWYRSLILTQIPILLDFMNTEEFRFQIFTCIEDGLSFHNELVVYKTLKIFESGESLDKQVLAKIIKTCLHPSKWVQDSAFQLLKNLIKKMDLVQNFSVLREVATPFIDVSENCFSIVTEEILEKFMKKMTRKDLALPGKDLKKNNLIESFKSKEKKNFVVPLVLEECFQKFEIGNSNQVIKPRYSIGSLKTRESFSLKGKLISSFNEHQSSVHNLHIFDGTLVSASSENVLKLWPVYQLDCFRSIKSSASIKYQSSVNSLGSCGDLFFVSCEQGVDLYSNLDFQNPSRIPDQDLSKTIRLSDQTLSSINQKGKLSIYDTRTLSSIQSYKFPFYGPLSNLCQGPHENILCLSTYIGAIILYDIRFACPASTLYHSSGLPIFALHSYDSRSLLVGSEDISILDVYSNGVTSLLSSSNDSPRIPAFCESIERDWLVHSCFDIGKRMQKVFESPGTVRKIISPGKPFVISAGNDALVKVWNIEKPKESCFIGQNRKKGADDIGEHNYGDVKIIQQKVDRVTTNQMILPGNSMKRKNYDGCPDHRSRSHNDAILDIVMHSSCPYLISSSRDGSIKVWN